MDAIGSDAVAVVQGSPATGAFDLFRQHNDFYYLCGVEVPHAYLLIDGRSRRSTLYLPPRDEKHERSEGPVMSSEDAEQGRALTGIDAIANREQLGEDLKTATTVSTIHSWQPRFASEIPFAQSFRTWRFLICRQSLPTCE